MNVLVLTLFVSISLVALLLLGFISSVRRGEIDHADRLSLLPLEDSPLSSLTEPSPPHFAPPDPPHLDKSLEKR